MTSGTKAKTETDKERSLERQWTEPSTAVTGASFDPAQSCEETRVVLLPVSPFRAHAYWDVCSKDLRPRTGTSGGAEVSPELILRLHEAAHKASEGENNPFPVQIDVPIHAQVGSCYIESCSPGSFYVAELGFCREDGGIAVLSRSKVVRMPFAEPALKEERSRRPAGDYYHMDETAPVSVHDVAALLSQPPSDLEFTEDAGKVAGDETPGSGTTGESREAAADEAAQTGHTVKLGIDPQARKRRQIPTASELLDAYACLMDALEKMIRTVAESSVERLSGSKEGFAAIRAATPSQGPHGQELPGDDMNHAKVHLQAVFELRSIPGDESGEFPPDKQGVLFSAIESMEMSPDLTEMSERRFLYGASSWS